MLEGVLLALGLLWLFVTLGLSCAIIMHVENDNYKNGCLISLKDFTEELFLERNLFGIILSIVIFIIAIPAMLLIIMIQVLFWIGYAIGWLWRLGDKKDQT